VGPSLASKDLKKVTAADNMATNGVVHIIDGVLLPPSGKLLSSKPVPEGKAIIETRSTGGLIQCYSGPESKINSQFTIDQDTCYRPGYSQIATFEKDQIVHCSPEGYENYIQVTTFKSGNGQCTGVKKSVLVDKDFCFGGPGDAVFIRCPEVTPATTAAPTALNIVELAQSVADLSTLVAAVVAGDLVDTLSSPGPFTVFAPTNEGFAALPDGTLDSLLKPENKATLVDILTFHVLPAKVLSTDLTAFQSVETVEGKKLDVTVFGGVVKVGASLKASDLRTVTAADNLASNGVVHIIDGVLLPPSTVVV